jgi:hypothetical protein
VALPIQQQIVGKKPPSRGHTLGEALNRDAAQMNDAAADLEKLAPQEEIRPTNI